MDIYARRYVCIYFSFLCVFVRLDTENFVAFSKISMLVYIYKFLYMAFSIPSLSKDLLWHYLNVCWYVYIYWFVYIPFVVWYGQFRERNFWGIFLNWPKLWPSSNWPTLVKISPLKNGEWTFLDIYVYLANGSSAFVGW